VAQGVAPDIPAWQAGQVAVYFRQAKNPSRTALSSERNDAAFTSSRPWSASVHAILSPGGWDCDLSYLPEGRVALLLKAH